MQVNETSHLQSRLGRLSAFLKRFAPFAATALVAILVFLIYNLIFPAPDPMTPREMNEVVAQVMASATPPPSFSSRAFQVIQPSLVLIQTQNPGEDGEEKKGLGSGVVVTVRGEILTSLHVVAKASEIQVIFADGTSSIAQIALEQPENDIALLVTAQIPEVLIPAILGNPNALRVGDETFAVGNPFGLYGSMSAGVISGFDRTFRPPDSDLILEGLIQFDAAVNPGNSGGPLLNRYGQVVGIVTGIVNPTEENFFVGVGFAVPIDVAVGGIGSPPY